VDGYIICTRQDWNTYKTRQNIELVTKRIINQIYRANIKMYAVIQTNITLTMNSVNVKHHSYIKVYIVY